MRTYASKSVAKRGLDRLMKRCQFVESGEVITIDDKFGLRIIVDPVISESERDELVSDFQVEFKIPHYVGEPVLVEKKTEDKEFKIPKAKRDGICKLVKEVYESIFQSEGQVPPVKRIKALAVEKGWNVNNAVIEYYIWRKSKGLTGRLSGKSTKN